MQTIHKYVLSFAPHQEIEMRSGQIIKCAYQRDNIDWGKTNICLWAIINDNDPIVKRTFNVIQTGGYIPKDNRFFNHIDTLITDNGQFVLHIFEQIREKH